jgi:hypothetical protein
MEVFNMKWYNMETCFRSLCDTLREYLNDNGICYELSGGPGFWHFEIKTDPAGAEKINAFITSVTIPGVSL